MSAPANLQIKRVLPPDEWVKRQIGNLKAVGLTNYRQGIAMPAKDPIQAGIAAEGKYAARTRAAIDAQRRAKALQTVTAQEWYTYANTFADRLPDGVAKREAKVKEFVNNWVPILESHLSKIDQIKVETDADAENKMLENLRGLKALKGAARGIK